MAKRLQGQLAASTLPSLLPPPLPTDTALTPTGSLSGAGIYSSGPARHPLFPVIYVPCLLSPAWPPARPVLSLWLWPHQSLAWGAEPPALLLIHFPGLLEAPRQLSWCPDGDGCWHSPQRPYEGPRAIRSEGPPAACLGPGMRDLSGISTEQDAGSGFRAGLVTPSVTSVSSTFPSLRVFSCNLGWGLDTTSQVPACRAPARVTVPPNHCAS